ncbi:MAG: serine/threonine-protein kinase PknK [Anaerolineales bacterium]
MQSSQPILNNRYELHDMLGRGGMGSVYRATDRLSRQVIALKRVSVATEWLSFSTQGSTADHRLALAEEFQTLASLRHPHIISVLDYGFDQDKQPFFTMDLLHGARTIRLASQALTTQQRLNILVQVLQALLYLHRRGIIHRDLKPGNVLVTADDQVRVLDFGLAVSQERVRADEQIAMAGTLAYMAPEQLDNHPPTASSDLYAWGILAYEVLTGAHPFNTQNYTQLVRDVMVTIPNVSVLPVPGPLQAIIARCMAKSPADRYAAVPELLADMMPLVDETSARESVLIRESYLQAAAFVGRDAELNQLKAAIRGAIAGEGSAWLVGGESGVGKSRFINEVRVQALVRGLLVLRGQGVAEGGGPYSLWRDALRTLCLQVSASLSDDEAASLKPYVPDLNELLGRDIPDAEALPPAQEQKRFLKLVETLFRRYDGPMLLIMEDLHWAEESLAVLAHLRQHIAGLPLLVLASYRSEERPNLPAELPGMQLVMLERLSRDHIEALSQAMLGDIGGEKHVVDLLARETEGNAYFMVEVMRALAEEAGELSEIGRKSLPQRVLAGGVQAVLRRRLARVSEDARPLVRLAAVAGRQLDLALLAWALETTSAALMPRLSACSDVAVLEVQDDQWRFVHDKLREALLEDLPQVERQLAARRLGEGIEALHEDRAAYITLLAEYWHQTDHDEKARTYAKQAAEQMLAVGNLRLAQRYSTWALQHIADPDNDAEAVEILYLVGICHDRLSDHEGAITYLQRSYDLAARLGDVAGQAKAVNGLGQRAFHLGDFAGALVHYEKARAFYTELNDKTALGLTLNNIGNVNMIQGNYDVATRYYNQAIDIRKQAHDLAGLSSTYNNLASIDHSQGNFAAARGNFQHALDLARQVGNRREIAHRLNNLGTTLHMLGELDAAQAHLHESLSITQEIEDRHTLSQAMNLLANVMRDQDDAPQAQTLLEQSIAIRREINDKWGLGWSLYNLALLMLSMEAYDQLLAYSTEGQAIAQGINERRCYSSHLALQGFTHLVLEQTEAARVALHEALDVSTQIGAGTVVADALIGLAWLQLIDNKPLVAAEVLAGAGALPGLENYTRHTRWRSVQARLEAALSPDELQTAQARGAELAMDALLARARDIKHDTLDEG